MTSGHGISREFPFDNTAMRGKIAWKCPDCGVMSAVERWLDCEPYCEDCGNHFGRICPSCGNWLDGVFDEKRFTEMQDGLS